MSQEIFIDFKPDMIVFWKVTCGNSHVWPIRIHITFSVRLHILSTWCCEKKFVHQLRVLLYLHEKTLKLHTKLVFLACYRMNSLFCNSSLKFQKAVREQNGQRVSLMNVLLFRGADWVWSCWRECNYCLLFANFSSSCLCAATVTHWKKSDWGIGEMAIDGL